MKKCPISIFRFDFISGSPFGEALAPQGDLGKNGINKLFLEFFLGGSILCKNAKFAYLYLRLPSGSQFGEALVPQGELESKKSM